MTLYHLTLSGVVAPCTARKKSCRYRDIDHFSTREVGKTALSQREAAGYTKPSMLKKHTLPLTGSIRELKVTAQAGHDPAVLGEKFLEILQETLPFNLRDVALTLQVIEETAEAVRATYSSLSQSSRPLKNRVRGVRSKEVKTSLTFVPDRVKTLLAREEVVSQWESRKSYRLDCSESVQSVQTPGAVRRLSSDSPIGVDEETGKFYWLGRKPRAVEGHQVGASYRLVSQEGGHTVKVKEPIFSLSAPESISPAQIRMPNSPVRAERVEAVLHGYSHMIQGAVPWISGRSVFQELAAGRKYSSKLQSVVRSGFPHDSLGVTHAELFPLASGALFFPEVRENYWSLGAESKELIRWTAGVWVQLAFCDLSSS